MAALANRARPHPHGVVLEQINIEAKTNEIPMFAGLLDRVGLARGGGHRQRSADLGIINNLRAP